MNYWSAEMTNLDVTQPLFDYFQVSIYIFLCFWPLPLTLLQKTWTPRGAFTAQMLYNISRGWVTHSEVSNR
jgi:alpha-L-fucosidase 2